MPDKKARIQMINEHHNLIFSSTKIQMPDKVRDANGFC
jgi:hypothetical protein